MSFTQLFDDLSVAENGEKKSSDSFNIRKAVSFLCLPQIHTIGEDWSKALFLKTKGLSDPEVQEAFRQYKKIMTSRLNLNQIAGQIERHKVSTNPLSSIFSFCNKVLLFAGIATSCYYLYNQWRIMKTMLDKHRKEDAYNKSEVQLIKLQLRKMAADLKQYQSVQENQIKILSEINSLKAILTSRQYFEEKKTTNLTMPSWQLNNSSQTSSSSTEEPKKEVDLQSNQINGHVEVPTPVEESLPPTNVNGSDLIENGAEKSSSEKKKVSKKVDRKQNSKNNDSKN